MPIFLLFVSAGVLFDCAFSLWVSLTRLLKEYNNLKTFICSIIFLAFKKQVLMASCLFRTSFCKASVSNFESIDTFEKIFKLLLRSIKRCSSSLMSICSWLIFCFGFLIPEFITKETCFSIPLYTLAASLSTDSNNSSFSNFGMILLSFCSMLSKNWPRIFKFDVDGLNNMLEAATADEEDGSEQSSVEDGFLVVCLEGSFEDVVQRLKNPDFKEQCAKFVIFNLSSFCLCKDSFTYCSFPLFSFYNSFAFLIMSSLSPTFSLLK